MHHGVDITDPARSSPRRSSSASLHHRPLPAGQGDRPDRAGAAARIKMEIDSKPRPWTSLIAASFS
ncbi:MAG: hypothetical protein U1E85_08750 [Rhodocyclaceae bacterium]